MTDNPPFKSAPSDPAPLVTKVARRVRFEEVDPLGIVWHGRYAGYFEDAREALGDRCGIGYRDFFAAGIVAPIRQLHLDYHHPLTLHEEFTIEARLHWSPAARLNMSYRIVNRAGRTTTTGWSIQMMVEHASRELIMTPPDFFTRFFEQWRQGLIPQV